MELGLDSDFGRRVMIQRDAAAPCVPAFSRCQPLRDTSLPLVISYCNRKTVFPPGELFGGFSAGNGGPGGLTWPQTC